MIAALLAAVVCQWNGAQWVCSGEGSYIYVANGGQSGSGEQIVVTNIVGVCTNCVAMSPDFVRGWKSDARWNVGAALTYMENALQYIMQVSQRGDWLLDDIAKCEISPFYPSYALVVDDGKSWLHSMGAYPGETPKNKAAEFAQQMPGTANNASNVRGRIYYYDGAAFAYQSFQSPLSDLVSDAYAAQGNLESSIDHLKALDDALDELSDEECTAQWDGGSGGGSGGGGSTVVTNQANGNWCTFDQGKAISETLEEIKKESKKLYDWAVASSNYIANIDRNTDFIASALWNNSTIVVDDGENSWSNVYVNSHSALYNYAPSNILQRIELLLFGLVEPTGGKSELDDYEMDGENEVNSARSIRDIDVQSGIDETKRRAQNIGDSFEQLMARFNFVGAGRFGGFNVLHSTKVFDAYEFDWNVSSTEIENYRSFRTILRSALQAVYWLSVALGVWWFYYSLIKYVFDLFKWFVQFFNDAFGG